MIFCGLTPVSTGIVDENLKKLMTKAIKKRHFCANFFVRRIQGEQEQ
jgi:hypothetical protein